MAENLYIPKNYDEWKKEVERHKLGDRERPMGVTYKLSDLSHADLCSGSGISMPQFLCLRTGIQMVTPNNSELVNELVAAGFCTENAFKRAKGNLKSNKHFDRITALSTHGTLMGRPKRGAAKAAFPDNTDLLGKFAALRRAICQLELWKMNGGSLYAEEEEELGGDTNQSEDPVINVSLGDDDDETVEVHPAAGQKPDLSKREAKGKSMARDEVLVLQLAVEFWNSMFLAASIKAPVLDAVPDQALFRVMRPGLPDGQKRVLYLTKVDGTLRLPFNREPVVDIIEAKRKGGLDDKWQIQYAAELVALVASKSSEDHKYDKKGYARAFLHAQNFNCSYFVTARYTKCFVDWLHSGSEEGRRITKKRTKDAFMGIRILGPRKISDPRDMALLGQLFLARYLTLKD